MAQANVTQASKLYIQLGDGGTPEVFSQPCGLNSRGLNLTKDTNDQIIPDCDDPDAPSWLGRVVVSLSGEATGSGVLDLDALPIWQDAFDSTEPVSARVGINVPPASNGGYYQGLMHLTAFNITGDQGDFIQVAVTLLSSGELTWVPAT